MSYAAIIFLGLIEGVTEFLPVSSTGHLLLAEHWLKLERQPSDLFNVVIQSGAVLAVLLAFASRLREMAIHWRSAEVRQYVLRLSAAFFVTAVGGLVMKKLGLKLPSEAAPVAWATLVGGVVILLVEVLRREPSRVAGITWPVAIAVGGAQLLAMVFPGSSRSGASIIVALMCGVSRPGATEFSFLLGVPTILAASGYEILSVIRHPESPHEPLGQLLLGTAVAAITAFLAVKWLLRYVQTHTFVFFGWYRIALGGLILILAVLSAKSV
jgi:undecaprenyl-diphosphatase